MYVNWLTTIIASNMSILTTTQSAIAADMDSYAKVSWLTSSYLVSLAGTYQYLLLICPPFPQIAMSSCVPLAGRGSQIFPPRNCVFAGGIIISCGAIVTALAPNFPVFILGRVLTGIGAACIFPVSIVFVLELTSKKRRGLFIGLVNSGFTSGVALGAVVAGALAPWLGWVNLPFLNLGNEITDVFEEGCFLVTGSTGTHSRNLHIRYNSEKSQQEKSRR
jgi:MFS family permease